MNKLLSLFAGTMFVLGVATSDASTKTGYFNVSAQVQQVQGQTLPVTLRLYQANDTQDIKIFELQITQNGTYQMPVSLQVNDDNIKQEDFYVVADNGFSTPAFSEIYSVTVVGENVPSPPQPAIEGVTWE